MFKVDVLPLEGEDFVTPAAGEHQQAQRRRRARRHPAAAFEPVEHDTEPVVFRLRQDPLAASRRILLGVPAGVAAGRRVARGRRPLEEPRQQGDRLVRHDGRRVEAVVQRGDLVGRDLAEVSRRLARLDARNQRARLAPRALRGPQAVAANGDAPGFPPARVMQHVDLLARGIDARTPKPGRC